MSAVLSTFPWSTDFLVKDLDNIVLDTRTPRDAGDTLTKEENAFLEEFILSVQIHKIRHALYGALLFFPLYLLSRRKLTNNAWDQEKMLKIRWIIHYHPQAHLTNILQLSKGLGNQKPAILVKIEQLLWDCLLLIATGKTEVFSALPDFFSKVPWDELAMISEVDQAHFADGKRIPESHYSQAVIKLSRCNTAKFEYPPSVV